jgi:oxygen-independent coproporphyrinogen-3 oxidase
MVAMGAWSSSFHRAAHGAGRDNAGVSAAFGVYVHIPFCATRCDYCDFATWTDRAHLIDDYVEACIRDIARRDLPPASSVFFGGGTPSLLPADRLVRILDAISRAAGAEVTVECNPDSVDGGKLRAYHDASVDRVSFGVQSMRPHVLSALGRTHDPDNVARAVDLARGAGILRVNLDLIYGTPGETVADWEATLDGALALGPDHVSAYALTVEPGTPLGAAVAAGTRAAPDDDDQAHKYEVADDRLAAAGLEWYEISNWARPGEECRHNLLYWAQADSAGIGAAAHGHAAGRRGWNVRTPERYVTAVAAAVATAVGPDPAAVEAGHEVLDGETRREERIALALRTRRGIKIGALAVDPPPVSDLVDELARAGLVATEEDGGETDVVLTRRGRLLANDVTARLRVSLEHPPAAAGTR